MTLRESLRNAMGKLTGAGVPSPSTAAEVLLLHVLGRDRAYLYAYPEAELTGEQARQYRELIEKRAAGTPTQYLTGTQEFWGLSFRVAPAVLIPRPETEHLVEVALDIVRNRLQKPAARIVDVGTGSGCIALALAHELPQAGITAVDISADALQIARENAAALGLDDRVKFLQSDLLEVFLADHESRFDLIVSNPPYVSPEETEVLPREVREHEPPVALFSPDDGAAVTARLIQQAERLLVPPAGPAFNGFMVLELGYNQAQRTRSLLGDAWTEPEFTNDLQGIPRVLSVQKK